MLYFKLDSFGKVSGVSENYPESERGQWSTRHDIKDLDHANRIAAEATDLTGDRYIGIDNGGSVWPRFDFAKAPKLGDKVSYGFNGDYYPDGEIVHITEGTLKQVKTSTGNTYYRNKNSGGWRKEGGTWWMVQGHRNERNPHF